ADVDGKYQQEERDQKWNAPTPLGERLGIEQVESTGPDHEQGEKKTKRGGCLNPTLRVAALTRTRMFCNINPCPTAFTAPGQALQQAQGDQKNRRRPANARHLPDKRQGLRAVGGQQPDGKGRQTHHKDGDEERVLAANQISDASKDDGTERTDEEARGVGGERRQQGGRMVAGRKKQRGKKRAPASHRDKSHPTRRWCPPRTPE